MQHQINFSEVKGYATLETATKRGFEVEAIAKSYAGEKLHHTVRWMVTCYIYNGNDKKLNGTMRFAPVFMVNNFPGGPGMFIGLTNVCCTN